MGFKDDIDRFAKKYEERAERVVKSSVLELSKRVVMESPVDTGRFRANWNVAIGSPDLTIEEVDFSGSDAEQKSADHAFDQIERAVTNGEFVGNAAYITNNLPYGPALEYGHSQKSPDGMVRISVANWPAIVKGAVKEAKARG